MNTFVIKVITIIVILYNLINFASVYCERNDSVKLLKPILDQDNIDWFVTTEDASNFSRIRAVPSDRSSKDIFLNTSALANKYGYETKEHFLTTKDGYKLTLFQIIGKGPIAFLMHGLLGSSDDFMVSGPGKALALLLADAGYDVWLGNARGNKYSREHVSLNPELKSFWEFCWHDIGVIDLPTMVDHALLVRKMDYLTYIGHGQGTTVFFVLTSEKPKYNDKFNLMISLGTIAWIWHIKSPVLRSLESISDSQFSLLENLGFYEIFPASKSSKICCSSKLALYTCITTMFNIVGYDYDQIDYDNACVKLTHFPSGSSLRQLQHYVQLLRCRDFVQFDYGIQKNLKIYGSRTPPPYDVESITVPIVIFYADNDLVSTPDDTIIMKQRLPKVEKFLRVPHSDFNHLDYIYAKNAKQLLYWKIIDIIDGKDEESNECIKSSSKCAV